MCAAWLMVAPAVSSWIVVATPGLTVNEPLGALAPAIGAWWRPSSAPTLIETGAATVSYTHLDLYKRQ